MALDLFTVGHSTRSSNELIDVIRSYDVGILVDVRRYPGSRRHPHFSLAALSGALRRAGVHYRHEEVLGGRRSGRPDSPNSGWRNTAFQAYADHANTDEFQAGLDRVLSDARREPTTIMCAEALPWRCHRRIIADHATLRGWRVLHILGTDSVQEHDLHPRALRAAGEKIIYPAESPAQGELWS